MRVDIHGELVKEIVEEKMRLAKKGLRKSSCVQQVWDGQTRKSSTRTRYESLRQQASITPLITVRACQVYWNFFTVQHSP